MVMRKLGRGLDSLIEETRPEEASDAGVTEISCAEIVPNPFQPRRDFDESALEKLTASIREHGLLQPVVVRPVAGGFELVAGERRWRAAVSAGLEEIPVVVREVADDRMLEIALVENLQREDLNPIEKGQAYRRYLDELGFTHQQAADRLGRDRSTITNQIRLLELSTDLQAMVSRGTLSMGHARALLSVPDEEGRRKIAGRVEREGLSVREVERLAKQARDGSTPAKPVRPEGRSAHLDDLERRLRERFATKARIAGGRKKGRIVLEYYSMDELSRLLELLLPEV